MRVVANEPDDKGWSDRQRELAALMARVADTQDILARTFRDTAPWAERLAAEEGLESPTRMADRADAAGYRLRTMQRVFAEQARNYDAMIAAGGPDNPEAYAAWQESCELATALMPSDFDEPDLDR